MMRDAYGRKRSSRSVPTGPGSRGGGPSLSPAYWRAWRASHPEYRERDNRRRLLAHNIARLARAIAETGTDAGYSRLATSRAGLAQQAAA